MLNQRRRHLSRSALRQYLPNPLQRRSILLPGHGARRAAITQAANPHQRNKSQEWAVLRFLTSGHIQESQVRRYAIARIHNALATRHFTILEVGLPCRQRRPFWNNKKTMPATLLTFAGLAILCSNGNRINGRYSNHFRHNRSYNGRRRHCL